MNPRSALSPLACRLALLLTVGLVAAGWMAGSARFPAAEAARRFAPAQPGPGLKPGTGTQTVAIGSGEIALPLDLRGAKPGALYSLSVQARDPALLRRQAVFTVSLRSESRFLVSKPLHQADPELFTVFRADDPAAPLLLDFQGQLNGPRAAFAIALRPLATQQKAVVIEAEPNNTWQEAQPALLGVPILGTADDRPYLPAEGQSEAAALRAGEDWFRFEQPNARPQLVSFTLDILDRDVPANILVFIARNGRLAPCTAGIDPVSGPHEAQIGPTLRQNGVELNSANKFTTRVLPKGTYYVQVTANHPAYRLHTAVSDPPPYNNPRQAMQIAANYVLAAGDSWFANTPRSGAVSRRDRQPHAETALCVACHPSHFALRGALAAYRSGVPIWQRESLRFLAERLYNNPRPFYAPSGASWARVISAAATVQGRAAHLLTQFEAITGEHRADFHASIARYLAAYYDRPAFPPDETEQNPPSISNFETGWSAWHALNAPAQQNPAAWKTQRDRIAQMMARPAEPAGGARAAGAQPRAGTPVETGTEIKNVEDLCFQTVALADLDRVKYADRIRANVARLFALQRPDGLWPYDFGAEQPSCEFETGAALFALAKAGTPNTDARVKKAVSALLKRQKPFGGWNQSGQFYEAFDTPFRETQFALMGLAAMFPGPAQRGWTNGQQPTAIRVGSADQTLADLLAIWDTPSPALLAQMRALARSPEPLVRWEAVNALCRLAEPGAVPTLAAALGDETRMVRRAAAQGLREIVTRRMETGGHRTAIDALAAALKSPRALVRRAALRAFQQHHRWLAKSNTLLEAVLTVARADRDPAARMGAAQALSLWWGWQDDPAARERILDTILAALGDETAAPVALAAFRETLYNLCDENIQYVYNFWIPLLPQEADRKRALANFEKAMGMQAAQIAAALRKATPFQTKQIARALTSYPVARDWNPEDQIERNFARIGNDLDAIDFRGPSALLLRPVILTLLGNSDPAVRQRALVLTTYLRSTGGQPLIANAIAARLEDGDADARRLALQAHRVFPFAPQQAQFGLDPRRFADENDPNFNADTLPLLTRMLDSRRPETQAGALRFLAEFGAQIADNPAIAEKAKGLALSDAPETQAAAFEIARFLPALRAAPEFHAAIAKVLQAPAGHPARPAALRLALSDPLGGSEAVAPALGAFLNSPKQADREEAFVLARSSGAIRDDPRLIPVFERALTQGEALRGQALQLLRQSRIQTANPAIRVALQAVAQAGSAGHKEIAAALLSGVSGKAGDPEKRLDRDYFTVKVQPLLAAKGADGRSCFDCHANHTILALQPPDGSGQFPAAATRSNYRSALRVIDLEDPERSLLLRKPLSPGVVSPETGVAHVGGVRWTNREHPAYQAVLAWLNGARVKQGQALGNPGP